MKNALIGLFTLLSFIGHCDEGMFLPLQLKNNYADMKASGLEMSYKKIYNPKKPSVKDAIVSLGGFCTAEIISPKGLLLTNHHCGYDAIREHSTPEKDYLTDGFWAMDMKEELPVEGLTASVVVEILDVTKEIQMQLNDKMDPDERALRIQQAGREIGLKAIKGTHYSAYVKEFYEGSEFYLFIVEVFEDVRLVGAPPSSIGKYGGDTDNWMWTRHTGDFSMFRIYAGPDNKPAEFSMNNQPYAPKHHLPVSVAGVEEGDFTMIMGYPGSTDRYLSSYGVKMAIDKDQPARVKIRGKKLELMKQDMDASDEIRLQYASTYAQVSNYWKYYIGQTEQLKNNKVYDNKLKLESDFNIWMNETEERKQRYGSVIKDFEVAYEVLDKINPTQVYFLEAIYFVGLNRFMLAHNSLYGKLTSEHPDEKEIQQEAKKAKKRSGNFFPTFNLDTEVKIIAAMIEMYFNDVPVDQHTEKLAEFNDAAKEDYVGYVKSNLSASVFTDPDRYEEFINNPTKAQLENDPVFLLNIDLLDNYKNIVHGTEASGAQSKLSHAKMLFIEALRKMNPDKKYYPDANSTLRLTYGNVKNYTSNEGKAYKHFTTIEGLMAKEDPNNPEFIVPAKLKELYEAKDYGEYGQDGTLWVNFISNNDITGGNSGSPVMNSKGELIGCAFDGNWEAMSGDIAFEDNLQRTISVDIRYILFIIDKYAGAHHLIDEMTIVR